MGSATAKAMPPSPCQLAQVPRHGRQTEQSDEPGTLGPGQGKKGTTQKGKEKEKKKEGCLGYPSHVPGTKHHNCIRARPPNGLGITDCPAKISRDLRRWRISCRATSRPLFPFFAHLPNTWVRIVVLQARGQKKEKDQSNHLHSTLLPPIKTGQCGKNVIFQSHY